MKTTRMTARDALRIVTIDAERLPSVLGIADGDWSETIVVALAGRGYVPIPLPEAGRAPDREGQVRLLALTDDERPVPVPGDAIRLLVAIMENAIELATAIGPLDDRARTILLEILEAYGIEDSVTRRILGAHLIHYEGNPPETARNLPLAAMDATERTRILHALMSVVRSGDVLYDVMVERFEDLVERSGLDRRIVRGVLVGPRDVVTPFSRPEVPIETWEGLPAPEARLLSWIAARPQATMDDVAARARTLGVDPEEGLRQIAAWTGEREGRPLLNGASRLALPPIRDPRTTS